MKKIVVQCGCGKVVQTYQVDDGKATFLTDFVCGECEICALNNGQYDLSPDWKGGETIRRKRNEKEKKK